MVKTNTLRVIVDADSCPKNCLQLVQKLSNIYDFQVITIASFNHQINHAHHLITGDEDQATDIAVMNNTQAGDIVITQDWGLAAVVLGKKARVIAPNGRIYEVGQIDFLLEEREILAKFRRSGGRTKGPAKRTIHDDQRFEQNLIMVLKESIS